MILFKRGKNMKNLRKAKPIKFRIPVGPAPKVIESKKYKKIKHKKTISEDYL